jgi:molybdopterin-guanine dinucleotide biosynthesis protein
VRDSLDLLDIDQPSATYTFVYNSPEENNKTVVVSVNDDASLEDLMNSFLDFVLACGFSVPDGAVLALITEVPEEESDTDEN